MLSLLVGSCIALDGFVWQVDAKSKDTVRLAYLIEVRISDTKLNKFSMKLERRTSLWKIKDVNRTARSIRCPKEYRNG